MTFDNVMNLCMIADDLRQRDEPVPRLLPVRLAPLLDSVSDRDDVLPLHLQ